MMMLMGLLRLGVWVSGGEQQVRVSKDQEAKKSLRAGATSR
jgi:hypothetical protein